MAPRSTHSATTQASSVTPTESASLSVATHETRNESHKHGTSAADLTAQPPTKKQAKANKPITDNEETENVQEKQDEEGISDLTAAERVLEESSLPVAPPKRGPSSDVPQPAAPVFTVTFEEEHESDGHETNNESENKVIFQKILKVQLMDQMQVMEMNQNTVMSDKKYTEDHTSKNKGSDISIISSKFNSNHTEDRTSKDKELDIIMNSPPVSPPCTTSGILRGNALGNHPNATDFHSAAESTTVGLVKRRVWLYMSNADPSTVMVPGVASFTLKHNLTATIGPVLKKLKDRAEHFFTADRCLYVYESKAWNILGNFESAVKDDEEVDWLKIDGEFILPILSSGFQPNAPLSLDIETYSIQSKSAGSSATSSRAVSCSHTPSLVQRGGISEQHTEELIDVLKTPRDILESTAPGLRVAYQRYLACIKAVSNHNTMDKNRTWPVAKATKKEIITVFVSSSAWYENYSNFDKIADFPAIQSWLAEDEDSPTDLDLWGFERDYYMFLDLKRWLKEKKKKRKGKGKSKEEKGGKDEKAHENKEKSGSKKCNWMVTFETYLWCLTLLAAGEQSFPNITFDVFSKFILSNFGENITLSATLVILFSMIDNVDLLSLHARQQNAKLAGEKNVDATAWIRLLARAIQEKIGMDSDDLFDNYEINEHTTQTGRSILLGTKLDEMARLLKLYPFNQERKVFEGQLKPVSHASIDPVHIICPIAAECETWSCKG
ncbi:hypothetical protein BDQ17DRAFT_1333189 [Cyathus striatus]|nr:hypothetical protein BDQ17DRAFT_1333189 [Cyathus striatus]